MATATTTLALFALTAVTANTSLAQTCPAPVKYCSTSPNSVGPGALMSWTGTPSIVADNFHLMSTGCPPGRTLLFYYGAGQLSLPFGNGWRCVSSGGVGIFRFQPLVIDSGGTATMRVDFSLPPAGTGGGLGMWIPGDTWYCQGWYRDPAAGGAFFNLSDGLKVQVCLDTYSWPLPGIENGDWVINNYVDLDPGPGVIDYRGGQKTYDGHRGVDIDVPNFRYMDADFPILAVEDGTVVALDDSHYDRHTSCTGVWNFVTVEHANGWKAIYGHLKQDSIVVILGQSVSQGQVLGVVALGQPAPRDAA